MRLSKVTPFSSALALIFLFQTTAAQIDPPNLSNYQPISGFTYACTKAYNTPLTDCSTDDFAGSGCSAKCIGFLDSLTNLLVNTCAGTDVYQDTLIGKFLSGRGAQTLCPGAVENSSSGGGGYAYGQSGGQNGSPAPLPAATEASTSTTVVSTSISTSSTTSLTTSSSTSSTTSTSSTPKAAATSSTTTVVVPVTVSPEPTTTSIAVVGTTVTPEAETQASTSTSHAQSSTSSSGTSTATSKSSGGGTPLDVGSSASRDAAVSVWLFALLAGSASFIRLL